MRRGNKMDKVEKKIIKAMKEDRLGDVIALQHKQLLDKEINAIKKKAEDALVATDEGVKE